MPRSHRLDPPAAPAPPLTAGAAVDFVGANGRLIESADLAALEELDDVVFDALAGDARALDRAATLWRQVRRHAPPALVDESREQYERQAREVMARYNNRPDETLGLAFAALEILTLLAE